MSVIIWSTDRELKWTDFKKKSHLKSMASANAAIGFESKPIIDHIEIGGKFKFKILDMGINAIFIPGFSWVAKTLLLKDKKSLLKHEQGHFDLVEELVRKSRIETTEFFREKIYDIEGINKSTAKKNAILEVMKIREIIEVQLKKEIKLEEAIYDDKTNHGLIKLQQEKYDKRFKDLR